MYGYDTYLPHYFRCINASIPTSIQTLAVVPASPSSRISISTHQSSERQPRIFPSLPFLSQFVFGLDRGNAKQDVDVSSTVFTERMASVLRSLNSSINASIALLSISPHLTMVSMSTVSEPLDPQG